MKRKRYELAALIGRAAIIDGELNRVFAVGPGFLWGSERSGFHRDAYSMDDARAVVAWLNGEDRQVDRQVRREDDPFDPGRSPTLRGIPARFNLSKLARRE